MAEKVTHRITEADVRHVAKLSRLRLSEDEVHRYTEQLAHVLSYIEKINELDLEGVEPMTHPLDLTNVLRDDEPRPGMAVEKVLANAPDRAEHDGVGFFAVPKVMGEGGNA